MRFARGDHGERGQIAGVVQQQVQLDGAFGALKLRPVKHRHAQVDDAGIDTEQAVFEPKLVASGGQPELSAALAEQLLEDGFEAASARMRSEVCRARPSKRVRTTTALVRRLSDSWSAFVEPIEGLNRSVYRV